MSNASATSAISAASQGAVPMASSDVPGAQGQDPDVPVAQALEGLPPPAVEAKGRSTGAGGAEGHTNEKFAGSSGGLDSLLLGPSFDASLDWAANVTAKGTHGCTLPKLPAPPSRLPPRCPRPSRPVGLKEARRLGWRFAPLLHQHPLDWSRLSDPGPWLASAALVDPLTYATTDLRTYLGNRRKARRAKTESAVAEAEAVSAAETAGGGKGVSSATAAKTSANAAKAAEAAAAADPYWLVHESYDTHNFFASRLVRRRDERGTSATGSAGAKPVARGGAGPPSGRRRLPGGEQRQNGGGGGAEREQPGHEGGGGSGGQPQEDPFWPHFEALQGDAFFDAIAGDPLDRPGEDPEEPRGGKAAGSGASRAWGQGRTLGKGGRLGGKVHYTVFEPSLSHLRWEAAPSEPPGDPDDPANGTDKAGDEPSFAYVYTFWFFYPFNGCSNQLMATRFAGRQQGAEYYLCPLGVHEGDWEHVKVYVCQEGMRDEADPAAAVAALQYSQHTWLPTYDCTQSECSFKHDPDHGFRRPLVYSGLHSHANSPHTSPLNVYAKINFKQLLNFDGIYVADRFSEAGPVFVPSPNNTAWLPFPHEVHEAEAGRPGAAERLAWAAYKGNWGVPLSSPNFSLSCLSSNLSVAGPCDPRNPPVFILDRLLGGVGAAPEEITWTPVLSPKRAAPELSEGITGPLVRRAASAAWERELAAPLWDDREPLPGLGGLSLATLARDTSSLACPLSEDAERTAVPPYLGGDPRLGARLRLFVAAATLAVLAAAAATALVVKCMPLILAPYHEHPASRHDHRQDHGSLHSAEEAPGMRHVGSTFALMYGYDDQEPGEPIEQRQRDRPEQLAAKAVRRGGRMQQQAGRAPPGQATAERDSDGEETGSQSSTSPSYGLHYLSDSDEGAPGNLVTELHSSPTARQQAPLSGQREGSLRPIVHRSAGSGPTAAEPSALSQTASVTPSPIASGGGATVSLVSGGSFRRGSGEHQPLLGAAEASGRARGITNSDSDDSECHRMGKARRGSFSRGTTGVAPRRRGCLRAFRAVACPAAVLAPQLAWRGCVAVLRGTTWIARIVCCCCCAFARSAGGSATSGGLPGRRRRRGLGPYLLGCAMQPERRLLWLSLGVMAYTSGLILSAQGLLQTLHALRNLLLRGLWAIAGLEGVFVALLAAGGLVELSLMVAAVALGPKPRGPHQHGDASGGQRRGQLPQPRQEAMGNGASFAEAPLPADELVRSVAAAEGAGRDLRSPHGHTPALQFLPTAADVAATAAAATAAASAATQAAAAAAAHAAAQVPWRTLTLLCAVGYMEVATSLHLLGFGLALWVGVLGASEGCSAAVQGLYRVISFSPDVCLDLSVIGVPGPRCGGDLMRLCNVWRELRLSGLLYGSLLIIASRLLLLVMATANYHSRHAVLLPLPPHRPGGRDLYHGSHHRSVQGPQHHAGLSSHAVTSQRTAAAVGKGEVHTKGRDPRRRSRRRQPAERDDRLADAEASSARTAIPVAGAAGRGPARDNGLKGRRKPEGDGGGGDVGADPGGAQPTANARGSADASLQGDTAGDGGSAGLVTGVGDVEMGLLPAPDRGVESTGAARRPALPAS